MVCIPCFIIPVLLFIWHRFIQPYVLRYWNPWAVKDAQGNVITKPEETKFPIDCSGGKCVFLKNKNNSAAIEPNDKEATSSPCAASCSQEAGCPKEKCAAVNGGVEKSGVEKKED